MMEGRTDGVMIDSLIFSMMKEYGVIRDRPEFDPYVSGNPIWVPILQWNHPTKNMRIYSNPQNVPFNVLTMECRKAVMDGFLAWFISARQCEVPMFGKRELHLVNA